MCLRTFIRRSLFYGKKVKLGTVHAVKLSRSTWHHIKIRERKAPSRGTIQKCEPHERSPCAPEFEERSQEDLQQERCARGEAWNLAKNIYKLKNSDRTMFHVRHFDKSPQPRPLEVWCACDDPSCPAPLCV